MDLYLIPLIGALIGWATNYIAVKMLFHPRQPINLLLFKIQGVFPKRQKLVAEKLGQVVAQELFSADDVKQVLRQELLSQETLDLVEQRIEQGLLRRLSTDFPLLAMMLNTEMLETIKASFRKELAPLLESMLEHMGDRLDHTLNVSQIVETKVASFSSDKLEEILLAIMRREFRFIEVIGGLIGLLIGLVQVLVVRNMTVIEASVWQLWNQI